MTRAYDVNNVIVDVKAVKRGKSCDCHCIVCDTPLIARQGKKNIDHFAHDFSNGEVDCKWSGETELHLRVKEYLSNVPNFLVPIGINNPTIESLRIDNVLLEMRYDPTRRIRIPDVTILSNGEKILVEIGVTSFCGQEKINEYKLANVNAIEFDFSAFFTESDVITDHDIERHFKGIESIFRWLSIAPAGDLGQRINNHERNNLHNLNRKVREQNHGFIKDKAKYEKEIEALKWQVNSKQEQLSNIELMINTKTPESERIQAAQSNYNRNVNELEITMSKWSKKLANQAKIDAELEFNTTMAHLKRHLEKKYLHENSTVLHGILGEIKLNEEKIELSLAKLTEAENDLNNKLSELNGIKKETDKYLQIKEKIEESLAQLAAKTRQIAQVRKQLNRILPEFNEYYRKTGSPCPFLIDVNKALYVDDFELLYRSLREKVDA
jgi:hypothetical protein